MVGKKGTGKTTLCRDLVRKFKGRVFVADYLGEYLDLAGDRVQVQVLTDFKSFYDITRSAWYSPGKKMLVLDEVEFICFDKRQKEIVDFLYRLGRHRGLDILAVSHRFFMIPVIIRAMTDRFYLFRITEPRDLKFLDGLIPDQDINRVKNLSVGEFIKIFI